MNGFTDNVPETDFSAALRAPQVSALARLQKESKERITIRVDADVLAWFRAQVQGGGSYQTLLNDALRAHMGEHDGSLERVLRRVIREELRTA